MGKKSEGGRDQKFTNKNIVFSYQVNTNDEAVPGFVNISDIDPNKIAKSVVTRPGYTQSSLFPISIQNSGLGTLIYPVNEAPNGNPTLPGYIFNWEDLIDYTDINDGYCKPSMIFTSNVNAAIQNISIEFQGKWTTAPTNTMTLQIYDYDMSTNQIGNQIGISSVLNLKDGLDGTINTLAQKVFNVENNASYKEYVRIQIGDRKSTR